MSYTVTIKEEISHIESTKPEMIAELSGFVRNNATFIDGSLSLTTENTDTLDRIKRFIKILYNVEVDVTVIDNLNFSKKDLYSITFDEHQDKILKALAYIDENNEFIKVPPTYIVGGNEEIRAYLRGVFFSSGSINDPKTSRYHMELLISNPDEAVFIQKLLNIFELNAKILNRERGYMIYIKEAEKISDYIKILGANKAVMYYENVRVYRDQKNKTNRLNNCEQANVDKMISTATSQVNDILFLKEKCAFELLDEEGEKIRIDTRTGEYLERA